MPLSASDLQTSASVDVERDEEWVRQLQEEQHQLVASQVTVMYKEYVVELEAAGPFATAEIRAGLQRQYEERLAQMRQMQEEELNQHIEMERQERLWSLGQQDPEWDGWESRYQASILANIKQDTARSRGSGITAEAGGGVREIRDGERNEDVRRRQEVWQRTEHQRKQDRHHWVGRTGLTRQRDIVEEEAKANLSESSGGVTMSDSILSSSATIETPASSVFGGDQLPQRRQPSDMVSPSRPTSARAASGSGSMNGVSPPELSGSPVSNMIAANRKREEPPGLALWTPPERAGEPARNGTIPSATTRAPGRKSSVLFGTIPTPSRGTGELVRNTQTPLPLQQPRPSDRKDEQPPSPSLWIPPQVTREPRQKRTTTSNVVREPAQKSSVLISMPSPSPSRVVESMNTQAPSQSQQQQPRPLPSPPSPPSPHQAQNASAAQSLPRALPQFQSRSVALPQPPFQPPSAPAARSQTLPRQPKLQSQPQPSATYSVQSPSSASYVWSPQAASSPPTQPLPTASSFSDPQRIQEDTGRGSTASKPAASPDTLAGLKSTQSPMNADPTRAPSPTRAGAKPALSPPRLSSLPTSSDERKRREDEANERRAEEARRRGAARRRAEEQARETERREANRRVRTADKPHTPAGPKRPVLKRAAAYENQWVAMVQASQLHFQSIPWPVPVPVSAPEMLLPDKIAAFILGPQHLPGKARKGRLKDALLLWHADQFEPKWLKKVVEEEKDAVKEGVGLVMRTLIDLWKEPFPAQPQAWQQPRLAPSPQPSFHPPNVSVTRLQPRSQSVTASSAPCQSLSPPSAAFSSQPPQLTTYLSQPPISASFSSNAERRRGDAGRGSTPSNHPAASNAGPKPAPSAMSADPVEIAVDVGTDVEDKYRKEEREADGLRRQDEEYRRSRTSAEALQSDDVEDVVGSASSSPPAETNANIDLQGKAVRFESGPRTSSQQLTGNLKSKLRGIPNLSGRIKIGKGPLRAGGFCDVYPGELAHERTSDRPEQVALKLLRIFDNEAHVVLTKKRFRKEVDVWRALQHPYVLPFYGTFELDPIRLFMVSPWAEGGSSLEYLRRKPSANRSLLLWQTASALEYLHSERTVHGDLKADNILISSTGNALLCDFGLSRHVGELFSKAPTSSTSRGIGHVRFAAPELLHAVFLQSSKPTLQSDVFAFASLMLQIYTEELPFGKLGEAAAILQIVKGELPPRPIQPIVLERRCDDRVWEVMVDCWQFEPSTRPDMKEVTRRMAALGPYHTVNGQ